EMGGHGPTSGMLLSSCARGVQPALAGAGSAAVAVVGAASAGGSGCAGGAAGADGARPAFCAESHCWNSALGTAFTTIGMKAWSLPHNSAHWPRYSPGRSMLAQASLTMP